jgi:uncharacterized protein with beta-barrel porin domain
MRLIKRRYAPSYRETDLNGGDFAPAYGTRTGTDVRSERGARFVHAVAVVPNTMLTLRAPGLGAHDWVTDPSLMAVFQTPPGPTFIVNGGSPIHDSALVSGGAELRLTNGVTLLRRFNGEGASRT